MKEALYPVNSDGLLEVIAPSDAALAFEDIASEDAATKRSPAIYAIPAAAFATAACGGGGSTSSAPAPAPPPVAVIPKPATDAEAARFILKASLSVTEAEITDIKSVGYAAWLDKQLDMPIAETGLAWMSARNYDKVTVEEYFYSSLPADFMVWNQLMTSPDAVRKRVAFALSEFLVVSGSGIGFNWRSSAMGYYWDQLNSNAFGKFSEITGRHHA
ncbi:DUF1800 family protein [Sphingorhabdus sp.]|uniref:DUF1800 family protein n=1 Tax=Sphingorhabdus sp. TaxID=1902408 RepID=UPI0039836E45